MQYVAIYRDGHLETKSKEDTIDASNSDSDRYEELLVNPTLIRLATQRGNIDCGGLDYLIVVELSKTYPTINEIVMAAIYLK